MAPGAEPAVQAPGPDPDRVRGGGSQAPEAEVAAGGAGLEHRREGRVQAGAGAEAGGPRRGIGQHRTDQPGALPRKHPRAGGRGRRDAEPFRGDQGTHGGERREQAAAGEHAEGPGELQQGHRSVADGRAQAQAPGRAGVQPQQGKSPQEIRQPQAGQQVDRRHVQGAGQGAAQPHQTPAAAVEVLRPIALLAAEAQGQVRQQGGAGPAALQGQGVQERLERGTAGVGHARGVDGGVGTGGPRLRRPDIRQDLAAGVVQDHGRGVAQGGLAGRFALAPAPGPDARPPPGKAQGPGWWSPARSASPRPAKQQDAAARFPHRGQSAEPGVPAGRGAAWSAPGAPRRRGCPPGATEPPRASPRAPGLRKGSSRDGERGRVASSRTCAGDSSCRGRSKQATAAAPTPTVLPPKGRRFR